jgi:hypothetical protein
MHITINGYKHYNHVVFTRQPVCSGRSTHFLSHKLKISQKLTMSHDTSYIICDGCNRQFRNLHAISTHWQRNAACASASNQDHTENNTQTNICINDFNIADIDDTSEDTTFKNTPETFSTTLIDMKRNHAEANHNPMNIDESKVFVGIKLLDILKKAKVPLYLYDNIIDWTKNAVNEHNIDFGLNEMISRHKTIQHLKLKFDVQHLEPTTQSITLPGSGCKIELVTHSFQSSLYSLLNDENLMKPDNLLIDPNNPFSAPSSSYCGDINTGSAFMAARKQYIHHSNELLCPIIFFIDRTHTDINGRLCLEPIRFTLGIFNRETRNNPNAWRTIGYIYDQAHIASKDPKTKVIDYHYMISKILEEFKALQKTSIQWILKLHEKEFDVFLKIPVMFIIGDTDGHDKMCGRYTSRSNIQSLCRCCSIPFDSTDDQEFAFKYRNHNTMMKLVAKGNATQLKKHSMHSISNAWEDVEFCDSERGLFGALCGDLMHCLQHGLYMYLVNLLFDQKKVKTVVTNKEANETKEILSSRCAFSESYCRIFDKLSRHYGKLMMHQSDRDIPRTHFYSSYVTTARKNASEMSGILLVHLMVLNSSEGQIKIDEQLGTGRTANFIEVIELMLMLEAFCNQDEISTKNVRRLKFFMPFILDKYKTTLNRQVGCKMKIIKFHLPLHFADDMLRFGTMKNFDTGIGESHHKTEAKLPAMTTQRRQVSFEYQTAKRQIENLVLNIAMSTTKLAEDSNEKISQENENKWFRYIYDDESNRLCYNVKLGNKQILKHCCWKDKIFQNQLECICNDINTKKSVEPPYRFFAQHNRGSFIFRADPSYEKGSPWYDWARIQWSDGTIPAKLMLFWEISEAQFKNPFTVGTTKVSCPGTYAIAYSLASKDQTIQAHGQSHLVEYSTIDVEKDLCIFTVDSIYSPLTGLPFNTGDDIIEAKEWIFLKPKNEWPDILVDVMNKEYIKYRSKTNNDNKKRKWSDK